MTVLIHTCDSGAAPNWF